MKDFVMWGMLVCFLVGIPMFFIGRFIDKTQFLMTFFTERESQSKLGDRLFWSGTAFLALGFVLILFVYPNL